MKRREWLRAMRSELDEATGTARLRWLLGMAWVSGLGLAAPIVAAGVAFGVVGGAIANYEIFLEVHRAGSDSWIGALALTLPTALASCGGTEQRSPPPTSSPLSWPAAP